VLGLLAWGITLSPGWPSVRQSYFDPDEARLALPEVASAFVFNVKLFLAAEAAILVVGVLVAVVRVLPAPALAPLRLVAVIYTDVFRGTPTLLVVFLVGFGFPALRLEGVPTGYFTLGLIALTLSYGAYVAEVVRAGIMSVHPSQVSSGRALGLTYGQTMRLVVLPQGLRRVMPPLLNDFVSLQKDTALVSVIGLVEALRAAQIRASSDFNFTPYVVAACFFIAVTVPIARFADWIALRQLRREQGRVLG
jgi:polar amino acid transport system permease protein